MRANEGPGVRRGLFLNAYARAPAVQNSVYAGAPTARCDATVAWYHVLRPQTGPVDEALSERRVVKWSDVGLKDRGVPTAFCMAACCPPHWAGAAVAACGPAVYALVVFAAGAAAVLHLQAAKGEVTVVRLVPNAAVPQLPVVVCAALPVAAPGPLILKGAGGAEGFVAVDAAGRAFVWRLRFDGGPLQPPSAELAAAQDAGPGCVCLGS